MPARTIGSSPSLSSRSTLGVLSTRMGSLVNPAAPDLLRPWSTLHMAHRSALNPVSEAIAARAACHITSTALVAPLPQPHDRRAPVLDVEARYDHGFAHLVNLGNREAREDVLRSAAASSAVMGLAKRRGFSDFLLTLCLVMAAYKPQITSLDSIRTRHEPFRTTIVPRCASFSYSLSPPALRMLIHLFEYAFLSYCPQLT